MNALTISLLILCYSLVLGIIFAQMLLTAPVVFKVLDEHNASIFLRKIFPRYYFLLLLISLISLLISYLFFNSFDIYASAVAVCFAFIGYIIIPLTNFARDRGWDRLFQWFHNFSVFSTFIIMAVSIIQIFKLTTL